MIRPERLGHVVIKVRDLEKSRQFYTEVLGMDVMNYSPELRILFLANNRRDHHELALLEVGREAPAPAREATGLVHFAFRLRSEAELRAAYEELKKKEVPVSFTVNHGITKSIYFRDPDGHELELYCDNSPEEYSKLANPYMGTDKLEFARNEPGLMDVFAKMRH
jgi:catechol 2,3-dioxygenase